MSILEYASSTVEAESHVITDSSEAETPEALHERNMAAFAKYQPEAHAAISRYKTQSKLIYTEDGEPDVEFHGESLYEGRGADAYTQDQLEKYWKQPMRIAMPATATGDNHAAIFSKPFLERLNEAEIGIDSAPTSLPTS